MFRWGGGGGGGDDQRLIYNVQEREEKDFRRKKSLSKGSPSSVVPMGLKLAEAKMVRNCIPTNISFQYSDF